MSKKNKDDKNRWRNVVVAFRVSPEERDELDNRVKLSGFQSKQDYLVHSVLHQKIVTVGNPLMMLTFRKNLQHIEMELERLQSISEMDEELLTPIRTMLEILQGYELDAKDNRDEISELLLDRIDIIRKRYSAEEKLLNLRQCMNKIERGEFDGRTEDNT